MKSRPFYVAVFTGERARDLVAVVAVLASTTSDAIQQAWDCFADHGATDPGALEYQVVPTSLAWRRRKAGRSPEVGRGGRGR